MLLFHVVKHHFISTYAGKQIHHSCKGRWRQEAGDQEPTMSDLHCFYVGGFFLHLSIDASIQQLKLQWLNSAILSHRKEELVYAPL